MCETVLIDEVGRAWPAQAQGLRKRLHATATDIDFSDYAIRNLGFVEIVGSEEASCRVRLRPETVGEAALGATLQLLSDIGAERVIVSHHGAEWRHDFYRSGREARDAITRLVLSALTGHAGCYRRVPVSPDELPSGNPLPEMIDLWRARSGVLDRGELEEIVRTRLADRFVLVRWSRDGDGLVLEKVGSGLPEIARVWLERAIGYRVEDQPDCLYGRWVAEAYRDARLGDRPLLETIVANIRWPRSGRRTHSYWRLILPFRSAPDAPVDMLLGATAARDGLLGQRVGVETTQEGLGVVDELLGRLPNEATADILADR
jgi:hypothetical protein